MLFIPTVNSANLSLSIDYTGSSIDDIAIIYTLKNEGWRSVRLGGEDADNDVTIFAIGLLELNITDVNELQIQRTSGYLRLWPPPFTLLPKVDISNSIHLSENYNFTNTTPPYSITAKYTSWRYACELHSSDSIRTWNGTVTSNSILIV